jgi:hypothetical protein
VVSSSSGSISRVAFGYRQRGVVLAFGISSVYRAASPT